ncbi:gallidermin/nisin family lantibiotic [Streptomyces murinus]|uniref:gallidermin/nisin family lantibiotic n=1 Tax=Streptomyces murinus TaxID=33900 RepID=UPI003F45E6A7
MIQRVTKRMTSHLVCSFGCEKTGSFNSFCCWNDTANSSLERALLVFLNILKC